MLRVWFDGVDGVVRCESRDFLTLEDVAHYTRALAEASAEARRVTGRVRVFVDSTSALVQSPEVIAAFGKIPSPLPQPEDKMAIAVSSALAKMQMQRNLKTAQERAFTSQTEAMEWLLAD